MSTYLSDHKHNSHYGRVMREWNAGSSLREARFRLWVWYRLSVSVTEKIWDELEAEFGGRSIPILPPRKEVNTDPAYLEWKGITGPGKQLRDMIKGR